MKALKIRQELGYPVIDGDGHVLEHRAVFADYCRDHGAGRVVDQVAMLVADRTEWMAPNLSAEERRRLGLLPLSWHFPTDTDYFADVSLPDRYYERLGEAGIDFSVLYPSMGLMLHRLPDEEQRVTLCRLYNEFMAQQYRPYGDRFTIAAIVPAHNPDEAIAEMVHAKEIGAKVLLLPSHVRRSFDGVSERADLKIAPWLTGGWIDTYGLDSKFDYDPVWAKAIELNVPLATHSSGMGLSDRTSISNYLYNQIGHFGASGGALAKSLFLGGVTSRFPEMRMAMLEGGVAIGVEILISLVATWEKRNPEAIKRLDPKGIDRERYARIVAKSAPELAKRYSADELVGATRESVHDDFELTGARGAQDIVDQFTRSFYWGVEGDDPLVGMAFDERILPRGAKVPCFMGSDIGHWDVPRFDEPLEEAYEMLERGILDEESLRNFLFTYPVRFLTEANPDFFSGTTVEQAVTSLMEGQLGAQ